MRNAMLLFVILVFVGGTGADAMQPSVAIGFGGGAAITTLVGNDTDEAETRTSPQFGAAFVLHRPGAIIGFQTGAFYVPKGATLRLPDGKGALEVTYIDIPLLLRIGLPLQGTSVTPVVALGGSLGIKTGCDVTARAGGVSAKIACTDSVFEGELDLKSLDLGVAGAASVDIPAGQRVLLSPTIQYTRGLTNIGDTSDDADAKNSAFQVGMGIRMRL